MDSKKYKKVSKLKEKGYSWEEMADIYYQLFNEDYSPDALRMKFSRYKALDNLSEGLKKRERSRLVNEVLDRYSRAYSPTKKIKLADICSEALPKSLVSKLFSSLGDIDRMARDKYPSRFTDAHVKDSDVVRDSTVGERFIITSAVTGCDVDRKFLKSIETYCAVEDATCLVLSTSDPAHDLFTQDTEIGLIDKKIIDSDYTRIVAGDVKLNNKISILTVKLSAKQMDPAVNMMRLTSGRGTFIFASPKQRLKPVASTNARLPHFVMTTGAITVPNYNTSTYMAERTAFIAQEDHVMGAIIVEIKDDNTYFFRQIQKSKDGSFTDLGSMYCPDGEVYENRASKFVLGDWHSGSTNKKAINAWSEVCSYVGVDEIIVGDFYDGKSISHHERTNVISRAKTFNKGKSNLRKELNALVDDAVELNKMAESVVVVKSNHDEVLERYLSSGYYVNDPENHRLALDLAAAYIDGKDPLKEYFESECKRRGINLSVKWLSRDEDYIHAGIQLGAHGDLGTNGSRGSIKAMDASYAKSVSGHAHSPEILRGAWQVGTSSDLKLSYNRGPSSWAHASCLVYPDGCRQMIIAVDGEWKL